MTKKMMLVVGVIAMAMASMSAGCAAVDDQEVQSVTQSYAPEGADDEGKADAPVDCSLVLCLAVECPEGFKRKFSRTNCCGRCVKDPSQGQLPEGRCRTPQDCDGLIHIMCVGSWSCDAGYCAYSCDGGEPISL